MYSGAVMCKGGCCDVRVCDGVAMGMVVVVMHIGRGFDVYGWNCKVYDGCCNVHAWLL